jgi:hypothetical protein
MAILLQLRQVGIGQWRRKTVQNDGAGKSWPNDLAGPRSGEQQKNAASPKGSGVLFDRDT